MIPRKLAKRLFDEVLAEATMDGDDPVADAIVRPALEHVLKESVFVLRGAENIEQKARRYLIEGRLTIERMEPSGLIVASCRGSAGVYHLGYDPSKRQWRCTCVSGRRRRCSHIAALRLVVDEPSKGGTA